MSKLSHFDKEGKAAMVDVSAKAATRRVAVAEGRVVLSKEAFAALVEGTAAKGDVLGVARLAGIMGAKRTPDLIPLCHPLALDQVTVDFETDAAARTVLIRATARVSGKTGVEMEAMTAVSVAALTIYDMLKAVDKAIVIEEIRLVRKEGGKSGRFEAREKKADKAATAKPAPRKPSPRAAELAPASAVPTPAARRAADPAASLRRFMAAHHLLASDWAKQAGVTYGALHAYLRGRRSALKRADLERLAQAANARIEDLVGGPSA